MSSVQKALKVVSGSAMMFPSKSVRSEIDFTVRNGRADKTLNRICTYSQMGSIDLTVRKSRNLFSTHFTVTVEGKAVKVQKFLADIAPVAK